MSFKEVTIQIRQSVNIKKLYLKLVTFKYMFNTPIKNEIVNVAK